MFDLFKFRRYTKSNISSNFLLTYKSNKDSSMVQRNVFYFKLWKIWTWVSGLYILLYYLLDPAMTPLCLVMILPINITVIFLLMTSINKLHVRTSKRQKALIELYLIFLQHPPWLWKTTYLQFDPSIFPKSIAFLVKLLSVWYCSMRSKAIHLQCENFVPLWIEVLVNSVCLKTVVSQL